MSTIFNVRNMKMPALTKGALIIGTIILIVAVVAAFLGWHLYKKLTTNTVVAEFPQTLALYPGDKVQIMGVRVGTIEKIEPAGDKMRVTFNYESKYKVPANATASILNPSLVASRTIQLSPPYTGGPVMQDGAAHPPGPHPGAGRVRRTARLDQPHPDRPRPHQGTAARARSATSSSRSPTVCRARASRSTRRSTACRRR